jgi:hypothetical protein
MLGEEIAFWPFTLASALLLHLGIATSLMGKPSQNLVVQNTLHPTVDGVQVPAAFQSECHHYAIMLPGNIKTGLRQQEASPSVVKARAV